MGQPVANRNMLFKQHYRFFNVTKRLPNKRGLSKFMFMPWATSLEECSAEELLTLFDHVVRLNAFEGWSWFDYIIAVGDSGSLYRYYRGTINDYAPTPIEEQLETMVFEIYNAFRDELPLHIILPPFE